MADTIITTGAGQDSDSGAGWFVALIILAVVIIGGMLLYKHGAFHAAAPATNIQVSLPNPVSNTTK